MHKLWYTKAVHHVYLFFILFYFNIWNLLQDKSSDVRKAAEACINEILRVSGQENVSALANCGTPADPLA